MKLYLECEVSKFEILEYNEETGYAKLRMCSPPYSVLDRPIDLHKLKLAGFKLRRGE